MKLLMQVGGDAFLGCPGRCIGEDRRGYCVVKAASERVEPWPAEERADRGTALRGDGSEIVISHSGVRRSSGLMASRIVLVATRV
jgi:hypothetical protein